MKYKSSTHPVLGKIIAINGSVIKVEGFRDQSVGDMVNVSTKLNLIGEIIKIVNKIAVIQCYEDTSGLKLNATVENYRYPLSMELGPGMLTMIYDGIQRPLEKIAEISGDFIARGLRVPAIDRRKIWEFHPAVNPGDYVSEGDIVGTVQELSLTHNIMVPPGISGKIVSINSGDMRVEDFAYSIEKRDKTIEKFSLLTRWPIRKARPYKKRFIPSKPLITGARVFDLLFPVAQGGVVAVPGGFGTGKTVVQHSLAKFADADVIVYIGCGERGNEMADLLNSFPSLEDPKNHRPLMDRTIMIANTSNMPVSAREASIFAGITMAEYWRDMGKNVLLLADSTSRWAEALRELSGRLEEMPTEGGYPAYLATRLSNFYERAGFVQVLGKGNRFGSITIVGSVSPPGGDFSEPVTTNTKRFVKAFWALDARLAYARHYPAVNWTDSYSLYDNLEEYWEENIEKGWQDARKTVNSILSKADQLESVAKLIGTENLPPDQQLTLLMATVIKDGYLIQNSFNQNDMYSSPLKTMRLALLFLKFYHKCEKLIKIGVPIFRFKEMKCLNALRRARLDFHSNEVEKMTQLGNEMDDEFSNLEKQYRS
ncbi:MAG: V-type ATP synthase subunit A [Candidatus Lokiarchaeota archaeon]|nr:V-type ATP synthase subunit A [Candidatus Harpocratesius repetitus]